MALFWIDGQYVNDSAIHIPPLSQTLHYGYGVYEGIRSYQCDQNVSIFQLPAHIDRLFFSASLLKMNIPFSKNQIEEACIEVIYQNQFGDAYLRPMAFMGDEFLGLHTDFSSVHVMVAAIPWRSFFSDPAQIKKGIAIKTSDIRRLCLPNQLQKAKANGFYLLSIMANNDARACGFQDALLLDPHGYVAEGTGANIFIVKNNVIYTPFIEFALDGITRKIVMKLAHDHHYAVIEKNILLAECYDADEVFFVGTAAEVLPITKIDNHIIGNGEMGLVTDYLRSAYLNTVLCQGETNDNDRKNRVSDCA